MKPWALSLGLILGATAASFALPPDVLPAPPEPERCFWREFDNLKHFQEVKGPRKALVEMNGNQVRVYVPCEDKP